MDTCASIQSRFDLPASSEFLSAFTHGGQSHTAAISGRQPLPVVDHFDGQLLFTREMDDAVVRMGMAHHIGDGLLHNAIAGNLNRRWQRRKLRWGVEGEDDAT